MYKYIIFDLDGTILDTIPDLQFNLNRTFKELGLKGDFSIAQTMTFVGGGKRVQIERALQASGYNLKLYPVVDKLLTRYYEENPATHTKPFPGVVSTLNELKNMGVTLYIATNKPENVARPLAELYFPDIFSDVRGDQGDKIVKPDKKFLNSLFDKHKINHKEALFVGDSDVDYLTASNALVDFAVVVHGYDKNVFSSKIKPTYTLLKFSDLITITKGN